MLLTETTAIEATVSKLVIYKANTATFLGKPILRFSGLSCYVPNDLNKWIHPYYNCSNGLRIAVLIPL
jgi:hypothetical protein